MDTEEILRRNPQVDLEQAEAYRRYVDELERAGIRVQPRFRLDPPLKQPPIHSASQRIKHQ